MLKKDSSDQWLRWTERCANMFACAKGGYANIFVRYSEGDRTDAATCAFTDSPQ